MNVGVFLDVDFRAFFPGVVGNHQEVPRRGGKLLCFSWVICGYSTIKGIKQVVFGDYSGYTNL